MISFFVGIAIGAAFAPIWMWVYSTGKDLIASKMQSKK